MNDQGLHARHPAFDATILAICLLFAAALAGLALGGDWYAGFIPAQAASTSSGRNRLPPPSTA